MSLDNLTPAEFVKWFQLGQSVRRMMGKEAEKYLYGGLVLPKLPEWDKAKYPYAVIITNGGRLMVSNTRPYQLTTSNDKLVYWGENTVIHIYTVDDNGVYSFDSELIKEGGHQARGNHLWTNTDLLNEDGTVRTAATAPVPIYE